MLKLIMFPVLGLALALPAQARDTGKKSQKEGNKTLIEHHQKMADIHEKAADCLERKTEAQCREELVKDCPMDKEHCSLVFDHGRAGKSKIMRDAPREVPSGMESQPSGESPESGPAVPDSETRERGY